MKGKPEQVGSVRVGGTEPGLEANLQSAAKRSVLIQQTRDIRHAFVNKGRSTGRLSA